MQRKFTLFLSQGLHGTYNIWQDKRKKKKHLKLVASASKKSESRKFWYNVKTFFKR